MTDDGAPVREGSLEESEKPSSPPEPGALADPVVRVLAYAAIGLVILFMATVVGVLTTGVGKSSGPRSLAEKEVLVAAARAQGATGESSASYVDALTATGNLPAARVALAQARSSLSATETAPSLDLSEARIASASGEYEQAVSLADKAMEGLKADYEARVAEGGAVEAAARSAGFGDDYYNSALVKAYALVELERWKDAVAVFDIYVDQHPTASDILIDRGNAKARLNDKVGAEKDFREALRFVPYDEAAKAGLKKLGVEE